jgi:hypothetical protein
MGLREYSEVSLQRRFRSRSRELLPTSPPPHRMPPSDNASQGVGIGDRNRKVHSLNNNEDGAVEALFALQQLTEGEVPLEFQMKQCLSKLSGTQLSRFE